MFLLSAVNGVGNVGEAVFFSEAVVFRESQEKGLDSFRGSDADAVSDRAGAFGGELCRFG